MKKIFKNIILIVVFSSVLLLVFNRFINIYIGILLSLIISSIVAYFVSKFILKKNNINQLYFVGFFLLILFIPFVGEKQQESLEKRNLKEFPEWRWSNVWKFFKEYQIYFDDRFAFRNELIDTYGKFKFDNLNITNITGDVAIGKEKWLFYSEKDYLNNIATPFSKLELQKFNYNLNLTTKWLEKQGIKYYLVIPPVKASIYSEMLPDYMKIRTDFSRYHQLKDYLAINSKINFIDCYDELMEAKKSNEIYYKTDTHWNQIGAFIGYAKIINVLKQDFPQLQPFQLNDFNIVKTELFSGDLLSMLGYESKNPTFQYLTSLKSNIEPKLTLSTVLPENPENIFEIYEMPSDTNDLEIYVVRDSYSENLKKFLSLNFKKSVYYWKVQLPIINITKEKPAIVLHEILERFSYHYLELPPEIKNDTAFTNQFNIADF